MCDLSKEDAVNNIIIDGKGTRIVRCRHARSLLGYEAIDKIICQAPQTVFHSFTVTILENDQLCLIGNLTALSINRYWI